MSHASAAGEALLVELLTEELPPKALAALGGAFARAIHRGLAERELAPSGSEALQIFATPRRLGALVSHVRSVAPDRSFEQRLVPASVGLDAHGQPTGALRKKLDALALAYDPQHIFAEPDGRQQILVYRGLRPGATLAEGLQAALQEAIERLPIPKVMNYQLADGHTTVQFVRPVHGLVALHGAKVVAVHALGLTAGRQTAGHRFHAPGVLRIEHACSYEQQLREQGKVIASPSERRARIVERLHAAADRLGARAVMPDPLVEEVTALVEWPVVYESEFDPVFLQVPQNCLILTMQQNQKYFALQDAGGSLRNRFLLVSNIETADPSAIVAGNARVVRARLADARFFFDQDRQHRLETRLGSAANVVYHHALGSQLQRIERLVAIARGVAVELPESHRVDQNVVARAALLAKADLGTLMVGEFPELQGEMGAIYARAEGEDEDVVTAIEEHYRPRFSGDAVPSTLVGACVALADKIETLAGLFGVGERPSGDRDPYALRRNALGILRILVEQALPITLQRLVALGLEAFSPADFPRGFAANPSELEQFLFERLRGMLLEQGYGAHEVDAVLSLRPGRLDRIGARMVAVRAFMQLPQAENLAAANKRIGNILKKAQASSVALPLDPRLLIEPAERELAAAFDAVAPQVDAALAAGDDTRVLRALVPLKPPVDRFFDEVMVMVDEPKLRDNRLALLGQLRALMNRIADISLLAAG
ncbi:MAG TPA: glycine--tRNA ligase subunit beta [Burkholderiaceae bacterium]|nr:glycine--tRNA ligase subunit beta [Burkholderiaceae bacterium]